MTIDDKISFFSGSTLTVMMTAPLYDIFMAMVLGVVGGFAGMIGKNLYYLLKDKWQSK